MRYEVAKRLECVPLDLYFRGERVLYFFRSSAGPRTQPARCSPPSRVAEEASIEHARRFSAAARRGFQGGLRAVGRLQIEAATRGAFGRSHLIAINLAVIGETEEEMTWLERAYEERDPLLVYAKTDPRLDPLRSDPRFDDLLRRIGFPED